MHGPDADREPTRRRGSHQIIADLPHQFLLDLEPAGKMLHERSYFDRPMMRPSAGKTR